MTDCVRGCTIRDQHTQHCTDHGNCDGCLPHPADIGHLCQRCIDRARTDLASIPDLAAHVASRNDGRLNLPADPPNDVHSHATRTGSPSGSPAWDNVDEVIWWAHNWAEGIADALKHAGPFRYLNSGVPARNLTKNIRYLLAQLERIAEDQYAARDIPTEAAQHRRHLERSSGRDPLVHRLKERCPSCDQRALIREDGSDRVHCRGCGRIWLETEYARFAIVAAS